MSELKKIHPAYDVYFRTYGETIQTRVTQLSRKQFTSEDKFKLVEPGRVLVIGDIRPELHQLLLALGKPAINDLTATDDRPNGIFSTRAFDSLRRHVYGDNWKTEAPRAKPALRVRPTY
ncbi:hypothetical protein DRQ25_08095 [Candidatus Fermentibacteria bacterium]|nr:MAG: hypothetical protein DRQ25_08095 [Candidatus Fermentibacteria bacterium]